jgi:dTDP-4-amino-4,6-dideoxygalactose transaminase
MSVEDHQTGEQGGTIAEVDRIPDLILGPHLRLCEGQAQLLVSQLNLLSKQLEEPKKGLGTRRAELSTYSEQECAGIREDANNALAPVRSETSSRRDKLHAELRNQTKLFAADLCQQSAGSTSGFALPLEGA